MSKDYDPVETLRDWLGEQADPERLDAMADWLRRPVKTERVEIDVEFDCGLFDPEECEVTSRWPDDMTRH